MVGRRGPVGPVNLFDESLAWEVYRDFGEWRVRRRNWPAAAGTLSLYDFEKDHGLPLLNYLLRRQGEYEEGRARVHDLHAMELLEIRTRIAFYGRTR